jgi:hypothetical protein
MNMENEKQKGVLMAVLSQYHQDAFVLEIHQFKVTPCLYIRAIIAVDNGTLFPGA